MPRFEAKYSLAVLVANAVFPILVAYSFLRLGLLSPWLWLLVGGAFFSEAVFFCQPISFQVEGEELTLVWISGRSKKIQRSEIHTVKHRSITALIVGARELKLGGTKRILVHTHYMVNGPSLRVWLPAEGPPAHD
jgi:hypothetical protein